MIWMIRIYALVFHPNVEFCLCLCTPLICRQINQKIKLAYSSINQTIGEVYLAVSGHCLFMSSAFAGRLLISHPSWLFQASAAAQLHMKFLSRDVISWDANLEHSSHGSRIRVAPSLFDEACYLLLDVWGEKAAGVPVHGKAAGIDEELLKVPWDIWPVRGHKSFNSFA